VNGRCLEGFEVIARLGEDWITRLDSYLVAIIEYADFCFAVGALKA